MKLRLFARFPLAVFAAAGAFLAPRVARASTRRALTIEHPAVSAAARPPPPRGPHHVGIDPNQPRPARHRARRRRGRQGEVRSASRHPRRHQRRRLQRRRASRPTSPPAHRSSACSRRSTMPSARAGRRRAQGAAEDARHRTNRRSAEDGEREAEERAEKLPGEARQPRRRARVHEKATLEQYRQAERGAHREERPRRRPSACSQRRGFLPRQEGEADKRLDLQRETVDLAIAAAAELLKKRVTAEDEERMAEEFLKSLPAAQPRASVSATAVARRYAKALLELGLEVGALKAIVTARRPRRRRPTSRAPNCAPRSTTPWSPARRRRAIAGHRRPPGREPHREEHALPARQSTPLHVLPAIAQLLREMSDLREGVVRAEVTTAARLWTRTTRAWPPSSRR